MAYGIVHQFPGGTQEQYEASIAAVHPSDGSLPKGQIFHAAGPSADGWTIIAVHESQESCKRDPLGPTLVEGHSRTLAQLTTPTPERRYNGCREVLSCCVP